jgi:ER membrane protein complex subunit 3
MQAQDYNKLFKGEKDNLDLAEGVYSWAAKDVEMRVLRRYGKIPSNE